MQNELNKKVALEISGLMGAQGGISVYIHELLRHLPDATHEFDFAVYGCFWRNFAQRTKTLKIPFPEVYEHLFRRLPQRYLLPIEYRFGFPAEEGFLLRKGVKLFHAMGQLLPVFKRIKTVMTVHQEPDREKWHLLFGRNGIFSRSILAANHLIAVSNASRTLLQKEFGLPSSRITVIHHGTPSMATTTHPPRQFQEWSAEVGIRSPYILCVAHINPHKNILILIEAFQHVLKKAKTPIQLVIVGRIDTHYTKAVRQAISDSALEDQVLLVGHIENRGLIGTIYQNALMLCFPTLSESFGMPVIEAMRYGCPVIVSDLSVMAEIANDAALLVAPHDVQQIANAMTSISRQPQLRAALISKGLARSSYFSWKTAAAETVAVYEKVLAEP